MLVIILILKTTYRLFSFKTFLTLIFNNTKILFEILPNLQNIFEYNYSNIVNNVKIITINFYEFFQKMTKFLGLTYILLY